MQSTSVTAIYTARALRDFGDGFIVVLLPVYLLAQGLGVFAVGVIATVALLGSAAMTLAIGLWGYRWEPRKLLIAAAGLMLLTGIAYALSDNLLLILLLAFFGTVNPSSGSVSIFVPLEHAVLSQAVADRQRTHMFSWYSLVGSLAAATGALLAGGPDWMMQQGIDRLSGLKLMFLFYACLGMAGGVVYWRIPRSETEAVVRPSRALGQSRIIVYKLAALFSIDAFAGGFVVQSLLALWLLNEFGLSLGTAGVFFFWTGLLSALSFPVAAWLAQRIGLVNTMVFTHIPSSLCLIAAAVTPNLAAVLVLLSLRAALSQMDVPTRSSYVMAVVTPAERPAAASVTSVPRSLAAALSPALAGGLFALGHTAWPLLLCGGLKIVYDLLLLWVFREVRPPEEAITS